MRTQVRGWVGGWVGVVVGVGGGGGGGGGGQNGWVRECGLEHGRLLQQLQHVCCPVPPCDTSPTMPCHASAGCSAGERSHQRASVPTECQNWGGAACAAALPAQGADRGGGGDAFAADVHGGVCGVSGAGAGCAARLRAHHCSRHCQLNIRQLSSTFCFCQHCKQLTAGIQCTTIGILQAA